MKRRVVAGVLLVLFFSCAGFAVPMTKICYEPTEVGADRWQYNYEVTNISLAGAIEEFTIWFDIGQYDNLALETLDPPAANWDELVWDPDPVISDDGGYDAWVNLATPIGVGQSISGFAVSFDWLGTGDPASQYYEIIDPVTFNTIDSGWTIPEPTTLILLGAGLLALRKRRRTF